jgi:hypothetical protein
MRPNRNRPFSKNDKVFCAASLQLSGPVFFFTNLDKRNNKLEQVEVENRKDTPKLVLFRSQIWFFKNMRFEYQVGQIRDTPVIKRIIDVWVGDQREGGKERDLKKIPASLRREPENLAFSWRREEV